MSTISIFATTCHKYACSGSAYAKEYDLADYSCYSDFIDAWRADNADERAPELDLLDVDDATVWPWRKIEAHELPAVIEFLTLDDDDRELVADYLETSEEEVSTAEELRKALAEAQERSIGHWKSFEDFTWAQADNWLACAGIRDKNARREILYRFNMDGYADELKQEYNHGSNGYIFIA